MSVGVTVPTDSDPYTEVELTISCRNLRDTDYFSKSDPMCVVYLKNALTERWDFYKRTEVIDNNLNPDFVTKIEIEYHFEQQQMLKFELYDVDTKNLSNLEEHDFLGFCISSLGQICSYGKVRYPLHGKKDEAQQSSKVHGEILLSVEELSKCKDQVTLKFSAQDLRQSRWGWCDPFLEVYKTGEESEKIIVFRSEVAAAVQLKYQWRAFTLPIRTLCGNDEDRNIVIACYDKRWVRAPRLIGEFYATLSQLRQGPCPENEFMCIHPQKKNRPNYTHSGIFRLEEFHIEKHYSFLDYIFGGLQIHCTIAIDFTASNGNPSNPESLHYIDSLLPNQYEQALLAVVEILQDYDSSKQFPVLGFGARLPRGNVSHDFYVNMHPTNPHCEGVQGVLDAYKNCIRSINLFYPTNFSRVISHVTQFANAHQDGSHYFILLIITDGIISDMPQTKKAIIKASTLPMSIIIVGVGKEDFSAMKELDGDEVPLSCNGITASRDIVQFVAFRDFQNKANVRAAKLCLAKEVLAEIPEQVVSFMKSKKVIPSIASTSEMPSAPPPPYSEIDEYEVYNPV